MNFKTPIIEIKNDTACNIFMKRDDLLPFSFGGNKVRIANEFFSDMKNKNNDMIIGYGNSRSNFCRVLANMSNYYGVKCCIVSPADDDGNRVETNNSRIVGFCGTDVVLCSKNEVKDTVDSVLTDYKKLGYAPYYIYGNPLGTGNKKTPVKAYYKVYNEIKEQAEELGIQFDYIFLATGTGMTQAGLIAGKLAFSGTEKIIGVSVARSKDYECKIINEYLCSFFNENYDVSYYNSIDIIDSYVGQGYGQGNNAIYGIIKKMLVDNGIPLDATYTGKAYTGMLKFLEKNDIKDKNVLFIHTGGTPLFFDDIEYLSEV